VLGAVVTCIAKAGITAGIDGLGDALFILRAGPIAVKKRPALLAAHTAICVRVELIIIELIGTVVADVATLIIILVALVGAGNCVAVVARIAPAVEVKVVLIRVVNFRAVVTGVVYPVGRITGIDLTDILTYSKALVLLIRTTGPVDDITDHVVAACHGALAHGTLPARGTRAIPRQDQRTGAVRLAARLFGWAGGARPARGTAEVVATDPVDLDAAPIGHITGFDAPAESKVALALARAHSAVVTFAGLLVTAGLIRPRDCRLGRQNRDQNACYNSARRQATSSGAADFSFTYRLPLHVTNLRMSRHG